MRRYALSVPRGGTLEVTDVTVGWDNPSAHVPAVGLYMQVALGVLLRYFNRGNSQEALVRFPTNLSALREPAALHFARLTSFVNSPDPRRPNFLREDASRSRLAHVFGEMRQTQRLESKAALALMLIIWIIRSVSTDSKWGVYQYPQSFFEFMDAIGVQRPVAVASTLLEAQHIAMCNALWNQSRHYDFYAEGSKELVVRFRDVLRAAAVRTVATEPGRPRLAGLGDLSFERLFNILVVCLQEVRDDLIRPAESVQAVTTSRLCEWMDTVSLFLPRLDDSALEVLDFVNTLKIGDLKPASTRHPEVVAAIAELMDGSRKERLRDAWIARANGFRRGLAKPVYAAVTREMKVRDLEEAAFQPMLPITAKYAETVTTTRSVTHKVLGSTYVDLELKGFSPQQKNLVATELLDNHWYVDEVSACDPLLGEREFATLQRAFEDEMSIASAQLQRRLRGAEDASLAEMVQWPEYGEMSSILDSPLILPLHARPFELTNYVSWFDQSGQRVYPHLHAMQPDREFTEIEDLGMYVTWETVSAGHETVLFEDFHSSKKISIEWPHERWAAEQIAQANLGDYRRVMTAHTLETRFRVPEEIWTEMWVEAFAYVWDDERRQRHYKSAVKELMRSVAAKAAAEFGSAATIPPTGVFAVPLLKFADRPELLAAKLPGAAEREMALDWFRTRVLADLIGEANAEVSSGKNRYGGQSGVNYTLQPVADRQAATVQLRERIRAMAFYAMRTVAPPEAQDGADSLT